MSSEYESPTMKRCWLLREAREKAEREHAAKLEAGMTPGMRAERDRQLSQFERYSNEHYVATEMPEDVREAIRLARENKEDEG